NIDPMLSSTRRIPKHISPTKDEWRTWQEETDLQISQNASLLSPLEKNTMEINAKNLSNKANQLREILINSAITCLKFDFHTDVNCSSPKKHPIIGNKQFGIIKSIKKQLEKLYYIGMAFLQSNINNDLFQIYFKKYTSKI